MMGLMILAVGLAIAGAGLFASALPATFAGTLLSLAGVGCWVAVRRRLFAVLRAPGEEAVQQGSIPGGGCCRILSPCSGWGL